jgi:hypothetical protein
VIELGVLLALLMGWQFTAAEFLGGPTMIVLVPVLFRLFVRQQLIGKAREQADKGLAGSMEGRWRPCCGTADQLRRRDRLHLFRPADPQHLLSDRRG